MEGTIGEIRLFAATFAPKNWWYCDGSIVAIRNNTALFSLLGTVYGGDGVTTFGLPNMKGRTAIGSGQGPGLSFYQLGQAGGTNNVTLLSSNMPPHIHTATTNVTIPAFSDEGDSGTPAGNILAAKPSMYSSVAGDTAMKAAPYNLTIGVSGMGTPLSINQPSIGMNYIICLYGVYPSRS